MNKEYLIEVLIIDSFNIAVINGNILITTNCIWISTDYKEYTV